MTLSRAAKSVAFKAHAAALKAASARLRPTSRFSPQVSATRRELPAARVASYGEAIGVLAVALLLLGAGLVSRDHAAA